MIDAILSKVIERNATNRRRWLKMNILCLMAVTAFFGSFVGSGHWLPAFIMAVHCAFFSWTIGQMIHWIDRNKGFE